MTANPEIISCSKSITIHCLESRQPVANFTHHRGIVNSVSINHNSIDKKYVDKVIASCGQDGKIFLVNAQKPENKLIEHVFYPSGKEKPSSLSVCAFSHNSNFLAVGSVDSVVKLWNLRGDKNQKDQSIMQIKSHMGSITSFAWIKTLKGEGFGSEILASSSLSGDIYIHSNKAGEFLQASFLKMQEGVTCIRASESNDYCRLAACTNGGTLAIWDLAASRQKPYWSISPTQNKASMTSLSFSPFSPVLLVTSGVDQNLMFYDILEKKSVKKILTQQPLSCVGLHRNGQMLVAGGMYGSIYLYDLRFPTKPQNKLLGHQTSIKHLQFYKPKEKQILDNKSVKGSVTSNPLNSQPSTTIESKNPPSLQQIRQKEIIKPPEPIANNFINIQKSSIVEDRLKEGIGLESKLIKASQQYQKPSLPKNEVPQFKQSADSDFYRNRSKQHLNMSGSEIPEKSEHLRKQVKELKEMIVSLKNGQEDLKKQLFDMEERITFSVIKQFQLHQLEMTKIIEGMLNKQNEKDKLIKKLEQENKKLKTTTF